MHDKILNIRVEKSSNRTQYIINHLFNNIIRCRVAISESFPEGIPVHINYTKSHLDGALNICPSGLLEDGKTIKAQDVATGTMEGQPILFPNDGKDFPFDIFAACFFCLTRMEETDKTKYDSHGRFKAEESIAYKNGFLTRPVVEIWCTMLKKRLEELFTDCKFPIREPGTMVTIDIDHPFKYRNKGFAINLLGAVRDLKNNNLAQFKERMSTLSRRRDDPYFSFNYLTDCIDQHNKEAIFFIHKGKYGKFDRKTIYPSQRYREIIKSLSETYKTGIHPSYKAAFDELKIKEEIGKLRNITGDEVMSSRFHFLRMSLPESYRMLERLGIREDYTMLYASTIGFRAGTSVPFQFYDIENEKILNLTIHPTCLMDTTMKSHMKMSIKEAIAAIQKIKEEVHDLGGDFVTLFHNSSLGEDTEWKGWREVFERTL